MAGVSSGCYQTVVCNFVVERGTKEGTQDLVRCSGSKCALVPEIGPLNIAMLNGLGLNK